VLACFFPGRPAFIEDNCESIIIDVTSPPEFFTCSIYCHPACQFVRVSDAGGSLFDLEVSLSVLSDSNKDVEATLNVSKQNLIHWSRESVTCAE